MTDDSKKSLDRAGLIHPESEAPVEEYAGPQTVGDLPEQTMLDRPARGFADWLYYHLTNLPTAVLVLSIISALSIIGTIVPQLQESEVYVAQFGSRKAGMLHTLGFTDIYHTLYFNLLLLWISVSAIWCSCLRFARTWRLQFKPRVRIRSGTIERFRHSKKVELDNPEGTLSAISDRLKKTGFKVFTVEHEGGAKNIYASRGMRRMWALVVLHFALIVILLGALINLFFGTNGIIRLDDGETKILTIHPGIDKSAIIQKVTSYIEPMTFKLELDEFEITYDKLIKPPPWMEGADIPPIFKEFENYIVHQFTSKLTVTRDERSKSKVISVNYPLHLDKLVFYQSAFSRRVEFVLDTAGESFRQEVEMNAPFEVTPQGLRPAVPGRPALTNIIFIIDDVKVGPWFKGKDYGGEIELMVKLEVIDAATGELFGMEVITKDDPLELPGMSLGISDKLVSSSIFQYKRDPGLPLVYYGFLFVVLGVLGTLFFRFQQVYVRIEGKKAWLALRSTGIAEDAGKVIEDITLTESGESRP